MHTATACLLAQEAAQICPGAFSKNTWVIPHKGPFLFATFPLGRARFFLSVENQRKSNKK